MTLKHLQGAEIIFINKQHFHNLAFIGVIEGWGKTLENYRRDGGVKLVKIQTNGQTKRDSLRGGRGLF